MSSKVLVSCFLNLPRFQFDRAPDVSALVSQDIGVQELTFHRFACSVPLTQSELAQALTQLRAEYVRSYRVPGFARLIHDLGECASIIAAPFKPARGKYGSVDVASLDLPSVTD